MLCRHHHHRCHQQAIHMLRWYDDIDDDVIIAMWYDVSIIMMYVRAGPAPPAVSLFKELPIDNRVNEGDRKLPFAGLLFPLNLYCSLATQPTYPNNAKRRLKDQLTRANFWRFCKTDTVISCPFFPSKGRAVIAKHFYIFLVQQIHFLQHLYLRIIAENVSI